MSLRNNERWFAACRRSFEARQYIGADIKNPIILPKEGHVVTLIVRHYHERFGHVGREHVLSLIRKMDNQGLRCSSQSFECLF